MYLRHYTKFYCSYFTEKFEYFLTKIFEHPSKDNGYSFGSIAMQADGEIIASSKTVQRRIPYKVTYRKGNEKQLVFESKRLEVQGCEDCSMKVTANRNGLTVQFGKGKAQYEITASGQIQNQGKNLHLQAQWTEVSTLSLNKVLY